MFHCILSKRNSGGSTKLASLLHQSNDVNQKTLVINFNSCEMNFWNNILGHDIHVRKWDMHSAGELSRDLEILYTDFRSGHTPPKYNNIIIDSPNRCFMKCKWFRELTSIPYFANIHIFLLISDVISPVIIDNIDFIHMLSCNERMINNVENEFKGQNLEIRSLLESKGRFDTVTINNMTSTIDVQPFDNNFFEEQYELRTILNQVYEIDSRSLSTLDEKIRSFFENIHERETRVISYRIYNSPVRHTRKFQRHRGEPRNDFKEFESTMSDLYRELDELTLPSDKRRIVLICAMKINERNMNNHFTFRTNVQYRTLNQSTTVERKEVERRDLVGECVICYGSIESFEETSDVTWCKYGCGNNFHTECIEKWLNTKKTCPLCREGFI